MVKDDSGGLINLSDYSEKFFKLEVEKSKKQRARKTGFNALDEKQIFGSGLYVLGGKSAVGTTTFCWQLLEQLAENGERCIFGTYLQSQLEIYLKSVARKLYIYEGEKALSSNEIMQGKESKILDKIIDEISATKLNLSIVEFQDENADDLINLFEIMLCNKNKPAPIICIDKFEVIPRENSSSVDILRKLKNFCSNTGATIILINSVNYKNYGKKTVGKFPIGIFTLADVVWLLEESSPISRKLNCLKNCFGFEESYKVFFDYKPKHAYFKSAKFIENMGDRIYEICEDKWRYSGRKN